MKPFLRYCFVFVALCAGGPAVYADGSMEDLQTARCPQCKHQWEYSISRDGEPQECPQCHFRFGQAPQASTATTSSYDQERERRLAEEAERQERERQQAAAMLKESQQRYSQEAEAMKRKDAATGSAIASRMRATPNAASRDGLDDMFAVKVKKKADCPYCTDGTRDCPYCIKGKHICPDCQLGTVPCECVDKKTGKADPNCPRCHGTGRHTCDTCNGKGEVDCTHCNTTGRLPCPYCHKGKLPAGYCPDVPKVPGSHAPKAVLDSFYPKDSPDRRQAAADFNAKKAVSDNDTASRMRADVSKDEFLRQLIALKEALRKRRDDLMTEILKTAKTGEPTALLGELNRIAATDPDCVRLKSEIAALRAAYADGKTTAADPVAIAARLSGGAHASGGSDVVYMPPGASTTVSVPDASSTQDPLLDAKKRLLARYQEQCQSVLKDMPNGTPAQQQAEVAERMRNDPVSVNLAYQIQRRQAVVAAAKNQGAQASGGTPSAQSSGTAGAPPAVTLSVPSAPSTPKPAAAAPAAPATQTMPNPSVNLPPPSPPDKVARNHYLEVWDKEVDMIAEIRKADYVDPTGSYPAQMRNAYAAYLKTNPQSGQTGFLQYVQKNAPELLNVQNAQTVAAADAHIKCIQAYSAYDEKRIELAELKKNYEAMVAVDPLLKNADIQARNAVLRERVAKMKEVEKRQTESLKADESIGASLRTLYKTGHDQAAAAEEKRLEAQYNALPKSERDKKTFTEYLMGIPPSYSLNPSTTKQQVRDIAVSNMVGEYDAWKLAQASVQIDNLHKTGTIIQSPDNWEGGSSYSQIKTSEMARP